MKTQQRLKYKPFFLHFIQRAQLSLYTLNVADDSIYNVHGAGKRERLLIKQNDASVKAILHMVRSQGYPCLLSTSCRARHHHRVCHYHSSPGMPEESEQ